MIGREEILDLVPHAGRMCLIDRALRWNETEIHCESDNHRDPDHPLRRGHGLSAVHLIEYSAQAAAVHGALMERHKEQARRTGLLVSVRDCDLFVECIHDLPGPLSITARLEMKRPDALMYTFEASHAEELLARGRITIMLTNREEEP